ncbi:hypothetical protein PIROE2DRAFT_5559, partial [Piromyces sp. E2]
MFNSVSFNNCVFKDIICIGESDNSSLIRFKSSDYGNTLNMTNITIDNCSSNGDLIIIEGSDSTILQSNLIIKNVTSYGSIINNLSSKSNYYLNNSIISNNKNINKFKCGLISYDNNINIYFHNSTFKNNIVRNNAISGGAIYMNESSIKRENSDNTIKIDIKNTLFFKNKAKYYGGAVYSDINEFDTLNIKNVSFIENNAYAGGAIYINGSNASLFQYNNENFSFKNNTSESHGNDLATGPYLINYSLNLNQTSIKSGEALPIEFTLTDKLNQTVNDMSKYYSNIILSINIDKNEEEGYEYENNDIKIIGNVCNFSKGKCGLNNFKIYSKNPLNVNLLLSLDNENKNIFFKNDKLKLIINNCDSNQFKMYIKGKYYYCENPLCGDNCPASSAMCIKNENKNTNDKNLNICECIKGWKGDECQLKDYAII